MNMHQLTMLALAACICGGAGIARCPPAPAQYGTDAGASDAVAIADARMADGAVLRDVSADSAGDIYDRACARLASLGCMHDSDCPAAFRLAAESGHFVLTPLTAACVLDAGSAAALTRCPGIVCAEKDAIDTLPPH